jgi:DNA-binding MarR family transcriptional regulator
MNDNQSKKKSVSETMKKKPLSRGESPGFSSGLPRVPESRYDLQILRSIRRIIRAVDVHSKKLKARYDLTTPQLICLISVADNGPMTATKIAQDVFLNASTVVGILDRLEKRDLVSRTRDGSDRRVVNVSITAAGRDLVQQAPLPLQDGLAAALADLSRLEQATISLSLKRIVDLMEAGHIEAAPILETDLTSPPQTSALSPGRESGRPRQSKPDHHE